MASIEEVVWFTEVALEVEDDDLADPLCSLTLLLITASRPLLLIQFELESLVPLRDIPPAVSPPPLVDSGSQPPLRADIAPASLGAEEPLLNFSPFRERGAETMASSEVSAALPPEEAAGAPGVEAALTFGLATEKSLLPFVRFVRAPFKISAGVGGGAVTAADGALSFFASGADCCAELGACVGG